MPKTKKKKRHANRYFVIYKYKHGREVQNVVDVVRAPSIKKARIKARSRVKITRRAPQGYM